LASSGVVVMARGKALGMTLRVVASTRVGHRGNEESDCRSWYLSRPCASRPDPESR
jgi:hypothetical protein